MARNVPRIELTQQETAAIINTLHAANRNGKPYAIVRTSDGSLIQSLRGRSYFPTKAAACCALSHLVKRALRRPALDELANRVRSVREQNRSWHPIASMIVMRALLASGAIQVREA